MNPLYYSLLHVFALFVLAAHTFMAFANPAPENRMEKIREVIARERAAGRWGQKRRLRGLRSLP